MNVTFRLSEGAVTEILRAPHCVPMSSQLAQIDLPKHYTKASVEA
jgi:hypothetical protein